MTSTRRVLLFAPYFLPRRRVGSMRPFRFAIHLRSFGWEPVVVTIAAANQSLTPKEAHLLKDVEIIEIHPPFDRTNRSESQLGAEGTVRSRRSPLIEQWGSVTSKLLSTIDRQFPTDTWLLLFAAKYRELLAIVRRVDPDVLWVTGDPWSALVTTERLARHFDLPWIADIRDPWTLSKMRVSRQWEISRRLDRFFERRVMSSADAIVFQASMVEAAYRQYYSDLDIDTYVIRNSFDPCVFDDAITFEAAGAEQVSTDGRLRIGFFGRFRAMSPAALMIDALHAVRRHDKEMAERIEVFSFGALNEQDAAYALEKGVFGNFHRSETVPLEKSLTVLRQFDLLLISTDLRRDQIIPAKIFEYLAAGRPIVSLSLNTEVEEILTRTRTGLQLDPRHTDQVAIFFMECLRAMDEGEALPITFKPDALEIARHEARHTTRELAEIFDRFMGA